MYDVLGFFGALLILFGFYRISIGKWTGKSRIYELDNLIGSIMVAFYQFHHKVYITMVLNVIWAIVALHGLTSYSQRRRSKKHRA